MAWAVGLLAVANRGLYVPWLVCRALDSSFVNYMQGIYLRPDADGDPGAAGGARD